MKRRLLFITLALSLTLSLCLFIGCGDEPIQPSTSNSSDSSIANCEHDFGDWEVSVSASCTQEGKLQRICDKCGEIERSTIAKTQHVIVIIPATDSTCTNVGYTAGAKCSVCGEILVAPEEISRTAHNFVDGACINEGCGAKDPRLGSKGLEFTLNDGDESYSVTGMGTCSDTDVIIPGIYNEKPVTSIGSQAFSSCYDLTSITIPNSVTSIGNYAFDYCTGLTSVTIGNSVTSIGKDAFSFCRGLTSVTIGNSVTSIGERAFHFCYCLTSITIPDSVTSIGDFAFSSCYDLTSITIPNSVTSIGSGAFSGCYNLTSITIPNSVVSIGDGAFNSCSGLERITVAEDNIKYHSKKNCLIETKSKTLIAGCKNSIIPTDGSVTSIGEAFYGCSSLTSITIPNSVTSIGYQAFSFCYDLTSINIPNSVTSIGGTAFQYCSGLTSVTIGNGVTSIGTFAFYGCSGLTSVTIPNSVTYIGYGAFDDCCGLTSVTIGNSVTSIDSYAFSRCYKLVEVINKSELDIIKGSNNYGGVAENALFVHNGESKIVNQNDYLFITYNGTNYLLGYAGNNTSLTLPNDYNGQNYEIYKYAFYKRTDLTSITIPNSVTSIGSSAFYECSGLTSITIPDSVTSIGKNAFYYCDGLTSVTIGNGVTSIDSYAFSLCYKLVEVINKSSLNITACSSDNGNVGYYALTVHNGESKIVNKNGYLFITDNGNNYLIDYKGKDTSLILPSDYNGQNYEINKYAFYKRFDLTSITIGNSVTSIGDEAFYDCKKLSEIKFEGTIEQWNTIKEGSRWDHDVPAEKVICTDGEVKLLKIWVQKA